MHILVVDDEKNVCESLVWLLESKGHTVRSCYSGEEGISKLRDESFDLVFLDVMLPGMGGLAVLKEMKSISPELKIVMVSGQADIDMAVQATKLGAYNFMEKPLQPDKILLEVKNIGEQARVYEEVNKLKKLVDLDYQMIGHSHAMEQLRRTIEKVAASDGRVMIYGENGSGKELVARAVHNKSLRKNNAFVQLNCAAIPKDLVESELFGYEKGAFTGANQRKKGLIELAEGGTLLLDEIGDMSLETQAKLLRGFQENEFLRLGGSLPQKFDVRIISATNKDLTEEINKGNFRQDLYYRLNVLPIFVPPLRDHIEDVEELSRHFLKGYCLKNGKKEKRHSEGAIKILMNYHWPGNIRELKNIMERLAIMSEEELIDSEIVSSVLGAQLFSPVSSESSVSSDLPLKEQLAQYERTILIASYRKYQGNVSRLAAALKTDRANLHRKLKQYHIKT